MLSDKKIKEWYQWGKDYYRSTVRMMRNNSHHPDYDTPEKRELSLDNAIEEHYNFSEKGRERLKSRFSYTDEDLDLAKDKLVAGFNASRKWYVKEDEKYQAILDKYRPIFEEAERIANAVDVSDIKDGFPCGSAHLYLQRYPEAEDLYKALGHFKTSSTEAYKRELPIKFPAYGQCISFDERICKEVNEFLRTRGVFASVHSWID